LLTADCTGDISNLESSIVAANHISRSDIIVLSNLVPNLRVWAHPTLNKGALGRIASLLLDSMGVIYTHDSRGTLQETLNLERLFCESYAAITEGRNIGIFPQGRYNENLAGRGSPGISWFVAYCQNRRINPQIVPIYIRPSKTHINGLLNKIEFPKISLIVGKPMTTEPIGDYQAFTDSILRTIYSLGG
jgi:1-acyl-sn-glycerol-3-phosphate acyltransferase